MNISLSHHKHRRARINANIRAGRPPPPPKQWSSLPLTIENLATDPFWRDIIYVEGTLDESREMLPRSIGREGRR